MGECGVLCTKLRPIPMITLSPRSHGIITHKPTKINQQKFRKKGLEVHSFRFIHSSFIHSSFIHHSFIHSFINFTTHCKKKVRFSYCMMCLLTMLLTIYHMGNVSESKRAVLFDYVSLFVVFVMIKHTYNLLTFIQQLKRALTTLVKCLSPPSLEVEYFTQHNNSA